MLSLLFLSGVFSIQAASHVRRLQKNQIEYMCGPGSLGLLLSSPQQLTFDNIESVEKISTVLAKALLQGECKFVHANKVVLPSSMVLCDYLSPHTRLVCSSSSHQSEYEFVDFSPPIRLEERPKFLQYQENKREKKRKELLLHKPQPEKEYPYESADIIGDNLEGAVGGYLTHFLAHHFGPLHPFLTYSGNDTGVYSMETGEQKTKQTSSISSSTKKYKKQKNPADEQEIRIALTADFGAGTREAAYVSELMVSDFNPHFTLHAGDVYYVGDPGETVSNTLGIPPNNTKYGVKFPLGSLGGFAMNGNHEMYSRGFGYFDLLLPAMGIVDQTTGKPTGQKASYSALENAYWRVIDLDTGYNTYSELHFENPNNTQPLAVLDWLKNEVNLNDPSDSRGIILVSHHQYFSAFGRLAVPIATPAQIAALLPANRTIIWLWGHEHRLAFYEQSYNQSGLNINVFGRCVGNGGFPSSIGEQPARSRESRLKAYDDRLYMVDIGFIKVPVGFNGWVHLTFQANNLMIEYRSLMLDATGALSRTDSTLLVVENFSLDSRGNIIQTNFSVIDKNITVVTHA